MPRAGDKIPLNLQLYDGADDKYVRAILLDANQNPISDSPVDLTNVGNGLYVNGTVIMPETTFVVATYKVFNDPSCLLPSPLHSNSVDIYTLDEGIEDIISRLENIQNDLNTILEQGISATLVGFIEEDKTVVGFVEE